MLFQHNKRPFADDDTLQLPYKQSRQSSYDSPLCIESINGCGPEESQNSDVDHGSQPNAFQTIPLTCRTSGRPTTSVLSVPTSKTVEDVRGDAVNPAEATHDIASSLSWPRCNRYEADICLDPPMLRFVPIGPDHQANIPEWVPSSKNSSGTACAESTINQSNGGTIDKWVGTCIIPMPDLDSLKTSEDVGAGRRLSHCRCANKGSVSCARQHVMEAREKLKMVRGKDNFDALGFSNMGEDVASKWSEEEEVLFHEIVFSNPPSLGKNFWNYLPRAFPRRSNKELVSYYFNVFMLRKRARQNMSDSLAADSDNDEWQECDDCIFAMSDEDEEDSVLDSPTNVDNLATHCLGHDEVDVHEEDGTDTSDNGDGDEDDCLADIPNGWASDKSVNNSVAHSMDENLLNSTKDQGVLDDSCMSYESQRNWSDSSSDLTGAGATQDHHHHHLLDMNQNDNLNEFVDHSYLMGHTWDMNYFCIREQQVDFSPTDVIEEVFQNETINNNKGSSN